MTFHTSYSSFDSLSKLSGVIFKLALFYSLSSALLFTHEPGEVCRAEFLSVKKDFGLSSFSAPAFLTDGFIIVHEVLLLHLLFHSFVEACFISMDRTSFFCASISSWFYLTDCLCCDQSILWLSPYLVPSALQFSFLSLGFPNTRVPPSVFPAASPAICPPIFQL